MAEKLYDLVVIGHTSDKPLDALIKAILALLGDNSPKLEFKLSDALLFNNGMASIKESITLEQAQAIKDKLKTLQVQCEIRPTLQLVDKEPDVVEVSKEVYTCPACGHQQPKMRNITGSSQLEACEQCGIVGERFEYNKKRQEVLQREKAKLENERARQLRDTLERAKLDEEENLRQDAKRKLGIAQTNDKTIAIKIAAAIAVLAVGLGGIYYAFQPSEEEIAAQAAEAEKAKAEAKAKLAKTMSQVITQAQEFANGNGASDQTLVAGHPVEEMKDESTLAETQKPEEREAKLVTALKKDNETTPAEEKPKSAEELAKQAQLKQEHETLRDEAVTQNEQQKVISARFQVPLEQQTENKRRIQQLLKLDEIDLADSIVQKTDDAYARTLLILEIIDWQLQHQQKESALKNIARIEKELADSQDPAQQALINGSLTRVHLLMNEWQPAGKTLADAVGLAKSLPQLPDQVLLITRLANEQALFGNQVAAKQLLTEASALAKQIPIDPKAPAEPISTVYSHIAYSYAMLSAFAEANDFMKKINDATKRQKMAEFIDKLNQRIQQVRAEYQQSASLK
jgi:ribosomal protein L37AE/L43A